MLSNVNESSIFAPGASEPALARPASESRSLGSGGMCSEDATKRFWLSPETVSGRYSISFTSIRCAPDCSKDGDGLESYRWSSLRHYIAVPKMRPGWLETALEKPNTKQSAPALIP